MEDQKGRIRVDTKKSEATNTAGQGPTILSLLWAFREVIAVILHQQQICCLTRPGTSANKDATTNTAFAALLRLLPNTT